MKIWAANLENNFKQNYLEVQFQIIIDRIFDYFIGYLLRIIMVLLLKYFE